MSKQLMKGNEALAEAALRAGCRFYSGYPITPQTEILEYLAKRMDEVGGTFVQTESELAGINMLLGASAAGARALTSSAGPGFSLNQEGISYLVAADLPAVIINVMRIGTGLGDIAQGQGDYWQMTRGGGHGDYRTIVLAPASVQENCDMMSTAFELAEKYRHPVLVASDAAIGQMVEGVELKDFVEHDIDQYDWAIRGCKAGAAPRKVQNVYYTNPQYPEFLRSKYAQMEQTEQRWELARTSYEIFSIGAMRTRRRFSAMPKRMRATVRGPSPSTPVTVPAPKVACLTRSPTLRTRTGLSSSDPALGGTPMRVTLRATDGRVPPLRAPPRPAPKAPASRSPHGSRPEPRERP